MPTLFTPRPPKLWAALVVPRADRLTVIVIEPWRLAQSHSRNHERCSHQHVPMHGRCTPVRGRLGYWLASIAAEGCAGPSMSLLPWSSRNGGYWSVINATYASSRKPHRLIPSAKAKRPGG